MYNARVKVASGWWLDFPRALAPPRTVEFGVEVGTKLDQGQEDSVVTDASYVNKIRTIEMHVLFASFLMKMLSLHYILELQTMLP